MGTVISNLKAKFGVDSGDFKKGLKDGEKAVADFKGAAGSQLNQFAEMFGIKMGAVSDAIGTAGKSLNFVGQSFRGASGAGAKFAIAINLVKVALISSGIGALVVALGSVAAYFQKTGKGGDQFARILMQIKSVINNVIDRLAIFGKGVYEITTGKFKQGWETMKGALKGIGDEMKEDWKAAGILADRLDALDDKEIALIVSMSERRRKVEELRLAARDLSLAEKEQLEAQKSAMNIRRSMMEDELAIEQERLAIMKDETAISASDPTDERRREIAVQEAKVNEIRASGATELKTMTEYYNTLLRKVEKLNELEAERTKIISVTKAEIAQLAFPDFSQVTSALQAPVAAIKEIKTAMVDVSETVNDAFGNMTSGIGEFVGAFVVGAASFKDLNKVVFGTLADLAIQVGKISIGAGFAVLGIKKALMTLNPVVAIAAGSALVALGSAVKGALSSAAGGASSASISTGSFGSGATSSAQTQSMTITLQGKLVAEGSALVAVLNQENTRRRVST